MKKIVIVQARMDSTRFPGKVMADLAGKPVIWYVLNQARKIKADEYYLATTCLSSDDMLADYVVSAGFGFKVCRHNFYPLKCWYWYKTIGRMAKADYIYRVCGDNPFIQPELANDLGMYADGGYDYISQYIHDEPAIQTKYGIFCELFKVDSLIYCGDDGIWDYAIEHVTPALYMRSDTRIKKIEITNLPDISLSIDTPEDLRRAESVIEFRGYPNSFAEYMAR